jgi:hypothetical protein
MAHPAISSEQAIAAAVLEKGTVPAGTTGPRRAAEDIRARMQTDNPHSIHESFAQAPERPNRSIVHKKIEDTIFRSGAIDTTTGTIRRTPQERNRYDTARSRADLALNYIERGFSGLPTAEQAHLRNLVMTSINSWPEARALINGITNPADRTRILNGLLEDPRMVGKVSELLSSVTQSEVTDEVSAARHKFNEAERQVTELNAQFQSIKRQYDRAAADISQFRDLTTGAPGTKQNTIDTINASPVEAEFESLRESMVRDDQEVERLHQLIDTMRRKDPKVAIDDEMNRIGFLKAKLNNTRKEVVKRQDKINERNRLVAEREEVQKRFDALEPQLVDLDTRRNNAARQRALAGADLNTATINRAHTEQAFVDSMGRIYIDAAKAVLAPDIEKAEQARENILETEKKQASDAAERRIFDVIGTRWDRARTTWNGRRTVELNHPQIERDLARLVTQGPNAILREILTSGPTPLTGPEADKRINENGESIKAARREVVEKLLMKRMSHNTLTEAEAEKIFTEEWGREAITNALTNNTKMREQIEQMQAAGVVRGTDHLARILGEHKNALLLGGLTLASLLMFLFSPIAVGALGTTAFAALAPSVGLALEGASAVTAGGSVIGAGVGVVDRAARTS